MGYTHYWHRPKTIKAGVFKAIRLDIERVAQALQEEYGLSLAGPDGEGEAIFSNQLIAFNGLRACGHNGDFDFFGRSCHCSSISCSHEDFAFERIYQPWPGQKPSEGTISYDLTRRPRPTLFGDFCKTEYKPYDVMVTAALLIIKRHLGNSFIVRSDGGNDGFNDAKFLCLGRLGYGDEYIFDEKEGLIRGYFQMSDAIADVNLAERDKALRKNDEGQQSVGTNRKVDEKSANSGAFPEKGRDA